MKKGNYIFERFKNVHEFARTIESRCVNSVFSKRAYDLCSQYEYNGSWFCTETFNEADTLLKNGWDKNLDAIKNTVKIATANAKRYRVRQVKSIAGFAPSVPDAIMGVPKSMLAAKKGNRNDFQTINIVYNMTGNSKIDGDTLLRCGEVVLELAIRLDMMKIRTRLDVIPKMSVDKKLTSFIGCSVTIKDYRQPFNALKIAYPLSNPSFFRRHGFRYMETQPDLTCKSFAKSYGFSVSQIEKQERDKYFEAMKVIPKDAVYIDIFDIIKTGYSVDKLMENKGLVKSLKK